MMLAFWKIIAFKKVVDTIFWVACTWMHIALSLILFVFSTSFVLFARRACFVVVLLLLVATKSMISTLLLIEGKAHGLHIVVHWCWLGGSKFSMALVFSSWYAYPPTWAHTSTSTSNQWRWSLSVLDVSTCKVPTLFARFFLASSQIRSMQLQTYSTHNTWQHHVIWPPLPPHFVFNDLVSCSMPQIGLFLL